MRKILAVLAAAGMLLPSAALAGIEKAGTTAANFLAVGAGADVLGMGGATLGNGLGLNAAAWNVAALGGLRGSEFVFSHANLAGESPQEWVAAGGRLGALRTRWGATALYQGDGTFEGRDALNNPTGTFSASSMALGAQFAQPIGPLATVGLGFKYVSEKLGSVSGGGVTFDAGLRLEAGPMGFGLAAQNAFGKMSYSGATYDFPTNYGAGVAYHLPLSGLTFALDANFPNAYYRDVRGGLEWRWRDRLALRSGYRKELGAADGEPLGGPTFGMGAGANGFWLDYGYLTGGTSGSGQHRVALTYHPTLFGGGMNAVTPDALRPARASALPMTRVAPSAPVAEPKSAPSAPVAEPKSAASAPAAAPKSAAPAPTVPVAAPKSAASAPTAPSAPLATPATSKSAPKSESSAGTDNATKPDAAPGVAVAPSAPKAPGTPPAPPAAKAAAEPPASNPNSIPAVAPVKLAPRPGTPKPEHAGNAAQAPAPTKLQVKSDPPAAVPATVPSAAKFAATSTPAKPQPVKAESAAAPATTPAGKPASAAAPVETKTDPSVKPESPARPEAPAKADAPAVQAPAKSDAPAVEAPAKPSTPMVEKPAGAEKAPAAGPRPARVKVKSGQTLADLARQWGCSVTGIMMENNLVSEKVKPGQTLKLPPQGR